ncbi:MAG TPA: hypothetical protein VHR42_05680, partial [Clostridia bacterium]|nr:hypothetical protein [Clostridia bacterium]
MTDKKTNKKDAFLTYKDKPLVRSGNILYYGNMSDKYVILMQILSTKTVKGQEIAGNVSVQLTATDDEIRARDRIIKKTEKDGLYNAIDIGCIWLERALNEL